MSDTLYARLGGNEGVTRIAGCLVDLHVKNPWIAVRFVESDVAHMKKMATDFFSMGSGGPNNYQGKDMVAAHKGMNIRPDEFLAVLDDAVAALEMCGVGQREKEEVLFIFFSMKESVVAQ